MRNLILGLLVILVLFTSSAHGEEETDHSADTNDLLTSFEDEQNLNLADEDVISREVREAGRSRPKKGKYKRPEERKGRRAKKGKTNRPGERKGRRSKKGKSKRPGERKGRDPNTIICPSCPPSECPPGQSPAPSPSPSPAPQPTPAPSTERSCVDTAVTAMKMSKDVAGNFIRQSKRIEKKTKVAGGKNDKKSVFAEVAATLVGIGGGDAANLTCAKQSGTEGAQQLQNLTSTLLACEATISEACNTSMPEVSVKQF